MAQKFFRYIPDFEYVSRYRDTKNISEYIKTKNLFKRVEIRPDIFNDLSYFTKYKIVGDERPDNVAYKIYKDENLDWLVMLCNNTINPTTEWPLTQESFDNYLLRKYGSHENLYSVHHYESEEVLNSQGRVIFPAGKTIDKSFSFTFIDNGSEVTVKSLSLEVTNYTYEERLQNEKRNIFLLKPQFIITVLNDLERLMPYKPGSSQYVSPSVVRGENIRLYQ